MADIYDQMVAGTPQLKRGKVWCHNCWKIQNVDAAECLRSGWPKCCDMTMSIDSPEELNLMEKRG